MPEVPPGWIGGTLADVTRQEDDRVGRRKAIVLSSTKHHGLVPSTDYFKNRQIFSDNTSNYRLVKRGWFAYATNHLSEGSIGLQSQFDEACVSPVYTVFSCTETVEPGYLYRLLRTSTMLNSYRTHEQASVDRRGAVRYGDFAKIEVLIPPLAEQRKMTEILDTVDESIRSTEHIIAKKSTLQKIVVGKLLAPDPPRPRIRMGNITRINVGYVGPVTRYLAPLGVSGVPLLSTTSIGGGRNSLPALRMVTKEFDAGNLKSRVQTGDVIVARHGESGSAAVIPQDLDGAQCLNVVVIRKCKAIDSNFLAMLLSSDTLRAELLVTKAGSTQGVVNTAELERFEIPIPSQDEQRRILAISTAFDAELELLAGDLEKLKHIKAGLMEDLLTGRVRVKVD